MTDTPDTSRETVERLTKWLRNWADAELAPTFQGDRAAHLGYIAAKQMDMLLARAEAAEAEVLAQSNARSADIAMWAERYDALRARLAALVERWDDDGVAHRDCARELRAILKGDDDA